MHDAFEKILLQINSKNTILAIGYLIKTAGYLNCFTLYTSESELKYQNYNFILILHCSAAIEFVKFSMVHVSYILKQCN